MMVVNVASEDHRLALDDDEVGGTRALREVESVHRGREREEEEEGEEEDEGDVWRSHGSGGE